MNGVYTKVSSPACVSVIVAVAKYTSTFIFNILYVTNTPKMKNTNCTLPYLPLTERIVSSVPISCGFEVSLQQNVNASR